MHAIHPSLILFAHSLYPSLHVHMFIMLPHRLDVNSDHQRPAADYQHPQEENYHDQLELAITLSNLVDYTEFISASSYASQSAADDKMSQEQDDKDLQHVIALSNQVQIQNFCSIQC